MEKSLNYTLFCKDIQTFNFVKTLITKNDDVEKGNPLSYEILGEDENSFTIDVHSTEKVFLSVLKKRLNIKITIHETN